MLGCSRCGTRTEEVVSSQSPNVTSGANTAGYNGQVRGSTILLTDSVKPNTRSSEEAEEDVPNITKACQSKQLADYHVTNIKHVCAVEIYPVVAPGCITLPSFQPSSIVHRAAINSCPQLPSLVQQAIRQQYVWRTVSTTTTGPSPAIACGSSCRCVIPAPLQFAV